LDDSCVAASSGFSQARAASPPIGSCWIRAPVFQEQLYDNRVAIDSRVAQGRARVHPWVGTTVFQEQLNDSRVTVA